MNIGPFLIPTARLFLLAGLAASLLVVALVLRGEARARTGALVWVALGAGALVARLGYVLLHPGHYVRSPLQVLRFWDGDFAVLPGIAAGAALALVLARRRGLRADVLAVALALGLATWGLLQLSVVTGPGKSPTLAATRLAQLDGAAVAPADFRGRPVVLNLWATWCPPCRREMPMLARAQAEAAGVDFLFVNQGESRDEVARYLAAQGLALRHVLLDGDGELARSYGIAGLPTTLVFDRDGRLRHWHAGELSAPRLADYLRAVEAAPAREVER